MLPPFEDTSTHQLSFVPLAAPGPSESSALRSPRARCSKRQYWHFMLQITGVTTLQILEHVSSVGFLTPRVQVSLQQWSGNLRKFKD